ncbi:MULTISPECIES: fructotransferase [unclassified Isoptericola]|uniref:fructotransferase n=1 Tax=unclassified Isoptericola TaxID=2623355 RepID=UPI0027142028|nr:MULTISPECIES: fructotransferase [unclassified Isoptericola]MDO8143804.1 fructotransferase [Isoptericola sp. 178]MDO8147699.1 fructotransferase [Isoptericola sp. b515]
MASTVYDVTTFAASVSPQDDIGQVINEIIADIHARQTGQATRPGAVVYIPPGHYVLRTTVVVDVGFLTIKGSGHGFLSEAIRDDVNHSAWVETLPGSSHVQIANDGQVGFLVDRVGDPGTNGRLNSVVFQDFCLDGMNSAKPYVGTNGNGKTGIRFEYDNDAIRVEGMGFVYLEEALTVRNADAYSITNNFIGECGHGVRMINGSIAGKITNNYIVTPWGGNSIFVENAENCLINGNSLLWGARIQCKSVHRAVITGNKLVSNFSGMIVQETPCHEHLISGNHFRRIHGDGGPARNDDLYGMLHLNGDDNAVTANMFSFDVGSGAVVPAGATPTVVLVKSGARNFLSSNQLAATMAVRHVVDASATSSKVLWSGTAGQLQDLSSSTSFVATP